MPPNISLVSALFEQGEDKICHPIAFLHGILQRESKKYKASERESFAIIFVMEMHHPHLRDSISALTQFNTLFRWYLALMIRQESCRDSYYHFNHLSLKSTIRKGTNKIDLDCISRLPDSDLLYQEASAELLCLIVETSTVIQSKTHFPSFFWAIIQLRAGNHSQRGKDSQNSTNRHNILRIESKPKDLITVD